MKKNIKKRLFSLLIFSVLIIIVFCSFDIYLNPSKTVLSSFVSRIIPYPAFLINNKFITVNAYDIFQKEYAQNLIENNLVQVSNLEQDKIQRALVQRVALEQIIADLNLRIKEKDFNRFIDNFYEQDIVIRNNKERLNHYILKPLFYRKKISERLREDDFNLENKKTIELIYGDIVKNPEKFEEYSEVYKDVDLGINGNLIGWLTWESLPDILQGKVRNMELNDFTTVLKSISGYHIYKLNGKIDKEGVVYYQFDQVFLPVKKFEDYLDNFLEKSKIFNFLKNTS